MLLSIQFTEPVLILFLIGLAVSISKWTLRTIDRPMMALWGLWLGLPILARVPWKAFWLLLAVLPGVYWLIALHPYQYVYYNTLTGGLPGAFRRYEMDYWTTSYREATMFINEKAPDQARILVWGPEHIVETYARQDLVIEKYRKENTKSNASADFAIVSSRNNRDLTLFPEADLLWTTGRGGAIFTVVKQLNQADPPDP